MRTASSCVIAALAMSVAAPANAQTPEAEVLFREGQRLMKEEQYAEACEKFEASERIEPASGTELNLALCREKNGQTASAWAMYLKAAASAKKSKNEDRASEAKERAAKVAEQLVYLTIEVPGDVEVEGLVIKRNKTVIDRGLWDQKVPVDPDEYTISAEAPGYKKWTDTVTVKTKSKVVEIPVLDKRKTSPNENNIPPDGDERPPKTVHVQKYRKQAITLAVIGGGGLVLGTGIGLYARNQEEQSDLLCPDIQCSDPDGVALNKRARSAAMAANISWALGGAALIAAGIVWYVGQSDHVSVAPVVDDDGAGVTVGGRF
jgi:hypothetical protein